MFQKGEYVKKFLGILGVIGAVVLLSLGIIYTPKIIEQNRIKESRVAEFSVERYAGWALAYNALSEANSTLYSTHPTDKKSEDYIEATRLNYPEKYFPDLIQEFGIAVQKDYSSNYIYTQLKGDLNDYSTGMLSKIKEAQNNFVDSSKPQNANDANVRAALEKYYTLYEKMNTSIQELTLEQSQKGALGEYIQERVGDKTFSEPIAYGQVAKEYLKQNLDLYKNAFKERESDGDLSSDTIDKVTKIVGLDQN